MVQRATLLAALVLALAGCGAGEPASDDGGAVAKAAQRTAASGGVRYAMKGRIGTPGAPGGAFPVRGEGTVDPKTGRGTSRFTLDIPQVGRTSLEQIMVGRRIYLSSPEFQTLTAGKKWVLIDLRDLGRAPGFDVGAMLSQSAVDPTEVLNYLRGAGAVKRQGTRRIGGATTTRYDAEIDLEAVVEGQRGDALKKSKAEALLEQAGVEQLPVTVFVGADRRIRRLVMRSGYDFTIDYLEYGAKLRAKAPAASEVMDIADLGAAAAGLGG